MRYLVLLWAFCFSLFFSQILSEKICDPGEGIYASSFPAAQSYVFQQRVILPGIDWQLYPPLLGTGDEWVIYQGVMVPDITGIYAFQLDASPIYAPGLQMNIDGKLTINSGVTYVQLDSGEEYFLTLLAYQPSSNPFRLNFVKPGSNETVLVPSSFFRPCYFAPEPVTNFDCSSSTQGKFLASFYNTPSALTPSSLPVSQSLVNNTAFGSPFAGFYVKLQGTIKLSGNYSFETSGDFLSMKFNNLLVTDKPPQTTPNFFFSTHMNLEEGKEYYVEINSYFESGTQFSNQLYKRFVSSVDAYQRNIENNELRSCVPPLISAPHRISTTGKEFIKIPVYLTTPPDAKIAIYVIPDPGAKASPCILYFDNTNWGITQYVYASGGNGTKIHFETNGTYLSFPYKQTSTIISGDSSLNITGIPIVPLPYIHNIKCTSWGDPHFVTFDGSRYDFYGTGDYYLLRSLDSKLIIQTRHQACGSASCNVGLVIKYDNSILMLYNDIPSQTVKVYGNNALQTMNGFNISSSLNSFTFTYPNSFKVEVNTLYSSFAKVYYMSIFVTVVNPYSGKIRGLCGHWDGDISNDYHDISGITTDLNTFTNSWSVPQNENLFLNENAIIPTLDSTPTQGPTGGPTGSPNSEEEVIPLLYECSKEVSAPPVETTPTINNTIPDSEPLICNLTMSEIEEYCDSLFLSSSIAIECNQLGNYNTSILYHDCITETSLLCNFEAAKVAGKILEDECNQICENCNTCSSSCNFNGKCENGKCNCNSGYSGDSCEITPFTIPCSTEVSPSSGKFGDIVTIFGKDFLSNTPAECVFGDNAKSTATVETSFRVTCSVPLFNNFEEIDVKVVFGIQGENCGAKFTLIENNTPCLTQDGFPQTNVGEISTLFDCPMNSYGSRSRECFNGGIWGTIQDNCISCPILSTSLPGSKIIEECECASGYDLNSTSNSCEDINECLNEVGCHINGYCVNNPGSFDCECLPGYDGNGIDNCSPDFNTIRISQCTPTARFLFDGNTVDSSGNNRTIDIGNAQYESFYMRNEPSNEALRITGNQIITEPLPMDRTTAFTILFNMETMTQSFDLIQLKENVDDTEFESILTVSVLPSGKFQWKSYGQIIGTSYRYLLTGRSYYYILSLRNNQIINFVEEVQIGTFNLNVPVSFTARLSMGRNMNGYIDDITICNQPIFNTNYLTYSSGIRCDQTACNPCYNSKSAAVCGQKLIRLSNQP